MTVPLIEVIARAMYDEGDWPAGVPRAHYSDAAGEVLTAISAAGYAVVPLEPTQDMISAGIIERHEQPTPEAWSLATANIYRAMIEAAQGDLITTQEKPS